MLSLSLVGILFYQLVMLLVQQQLLVRDLITPRDIQWLITCYQAVYASVCLITCYSLPFIRIECYSGSVSCIAAIYRYSGSVSCIAAELLVEQGILIDSCISIHRCLVIAIKQCCLFHNIYRWIIIHWSLIIHTLLMQLLFTTLVIAPLLDILCEASFQQLIVVALFLAH